MKHLWNAKFEILSKIARGTAASIAATFVWTTINYLSLFFVIDERKYISM